MDILSHAAAGAASGFVVGRPLLGMVCGILPDLVLGLKRRKLPPIQYDLTHSLLFAFYAGAALLFLTNSLAPFLAFLSHIVLDLPTHGKQWAPPLFWPMSRRRYSFGDEWEWFNPSWWDGFVLTLIWITACLVTSFAFSPIGFPL